MNKANSVHLDGGLESVRVMGSKDGMTLARLSVYTLVPRPGADPSGPPSERYEQMRHLVGVVVPAAGDRWLRDLESAVRAEPRRNRPCSVDGYLVTEGDVSVVRCGPEGFVLKDRMRMDRNNEAHIVGKVVSATYTDASASLVVSTGVSDVRVRIPRSLSEQAWSEISSGNVGKGDGVDLSGPLVSGDFSDGRGRGMFVSMVSVHSLAKVQLDIERKPDRGRGVRH